MPAEKKHNKLAKTSSQSTFFNSLKNPILIIIIILLIILIIKFWLGSAIGTPIGNSPGRLDCVEGTESYSIEEILNNSACKSQHVVQIDKCKGKSKPKQDIKQYMCLSINS